MSDKRIKIKGGAEYCFRSLAGRNSTAVGIWIREGARHEPARFKGIAHYLEHLLFKGSRKYSYRKIKEKIEGCGGQLNGFTSQEATCYYARVLNRNVSTTLDILLDMVMDPLLKETDIKKERKVIHEEINMYNDMPSARVMSILDAMLWPADPLGIDVIGTPETVDAISRDDLLAFKKKFYRPANMVVTVCGQEAVEIFDVIKDRLESPEKSIKKEQNRHRILIPRGFQIEKEIKPFNQSHIAIGFPGMDYNSKDKYVMEVIHTVLGANMSSRLFESLREKKGLAYDVSTSTRKYADTGAFMIHCGLDGANLHTATKLIFRETDIIRNEPVPARELKRAQDYMLGNLLMNFESSLSNMLYVGESIVARDKIHDYNYIEDRILSVTPDDILRVARDIFRYDHAKAAVVTNNNDEHLEEKLKRCLDG